MIDAPSAILKREYKSKECSATCWIDVFNKFWESETFEFEKQNHFLDNDEEKLFSLIMTIIYLYYIISAHYIIFSYFFYISVKPFNARMQLLKQFSVNYGRDFPIFRE